MVAIYKIAEMAKDKAISCPHCMGIRYGFWRRLRGYLAYAFWMRLPNVLAFSRPGFAILPHAGDHAFGCTCPIDDLDLAPNQDTPHE